MTYIFPGVVIGTLYALLGISITLTYSTTGILNLATGALAYVSADLFYRLVSVDAWNTWVAAALCVLVVSPILGALMWWAVFRRLERSDLTVQMVATIGLAVALPSFMQLILPSEAAAQTPGLLTNGLRSVSLGFVHANRDQVVAVTGAVICIGALYVLVERSRFGLSTRAVVDRPLLAETRGISTTRMSVASWVLATMMTGVAGILLSPLITLDPARYAQFTVAALGVALVGRFRNQLPTAAAAVGLGVLSSLLTGYAPVGGLIGNGLVPGLPFFLLAAMLLLGRLPLSGRRDVVEGDGTRTESPPLKSPAAANIRGTPVVAIKWLVGSAVAIAGMAISLTVFNVYWTGVLAEGASFAVLFLSFSVATGEGGVLCLGQAGLAATGAFVTGRLATEAGVPLALATIAGIVAAIMVGTILGLVAIRLDKVGFALITLAFALFCDQFLFNTTSLVPIVGVSFPLVHFGGLSPIRSQLLLSGLVFAAVAAGLGTLRRGRAGRSYAALRDNPVSSEALGLNVKALRIGIFAFGSGIAGLGGTLYGFDTQLVTPTDYSLALGLTWLAVVVTLGVRGYLGALLAGLMYAVVPAALALVHGHNLGNLAPVLFGLGAVGLAQEPRGALAQTTRGLRQVLALLGARASGSDLGRPGRLVMSSSGSGEPG